MDREIESRHIFIAQYSKFPQLWGHFLPNIFCFNLLPHILDFCGKKTEPRLTASKVKNCYPTNGDRRILLAEFIFITNQRDLFERWNSWGPADQGDRMSLRKNHQKC
jgi:hypothetical protein